MSRTWLLAAAGIVLAAPAAAQDGRDLDAVMCRNGLFAIAPPFQEAQIFGEGRAYLLGDMDGCPEAAECRLSASPYLMAGDKVVVSKLRMGHACVYFPNEVGGTAGYLPLERLRLSETDTMPALSRWLGGWSNFGNPALTITQTGEGLTVSGTALWHGGETASGDAIIHDGQIEGPLTVMGNRARYDDGTCLADFTLLGEVLLVADNSQCGGMNVRFVDVLQRDVAEG